MKRKAYTSYSAKPGKKSKFFTRQNYTKSLLVPSRYAVAPKKVELKYDDGTYTITTDQVVLLTTIANGTGPSDRIGRHVQYHDIQFNLFWQLASGYNTTRVVLFYDRQSNGASPGLSDVLNSSTDVHALYNPDNRSRFKILWDKTIDFDTANVGTKAIINQRVSLKNLRCEFLGSTSAVTDIDMGAIYFLHINSNGTTLTTKCRNRLQYYD